MIVRLDGDLAGEFATRLTIEQLGLGDAADQRRSSAAPSARCPFRFNITIKGPFRSLIQTAKSFRDPRQQIGDRAAAAARGRSRDRHRGPPPRRGPAAIANPGRQETVTPTPPARDDYDPPIDDPARGRGRRLRPCRWPAASRSRPPEKPIEINLNVTIRQEVLVRLQRDVEQLIQQNPQAFPQQQPQPAEMRTGSSRRRCSRARPAVAQTPAVNAARAAGLVGERYDGYLGFAAPRLRQPFAARSRRSTSAAARSTAGWPRRKGVSPQDVGITAGCQLLARVAVGEAYLWTDGRWRRRGPGQVRRCRTIAAESGPLRLTN